MNKVKVSNEMIINLYLQEKNMLKVSKTFNISQNKVKLALIKGKVDIKTNYWSNEDTEYLYRSYGKLKISYIAKKLNRTEIAVIKKAKRLKLGPSKLASGDIDLKNFSKNFGISEKSLKNLIIKKGFPAEKKIIYRNKLIWRINIDKFWHWAKLNQDLYSLAKMEEGIFGIEDNWVKEKRKEDKAKLSLKKNLRYTEYEDSLIIMLINQGKTRKCIAEKLNRSVYSIGSRMKRLGIKSQRKSKNM